MKRFWKSPSARPKAGLVPVSTSDLTRAGYVAANSWAIMPPKLWPTMCARSTPRSSSSASSDAAKPGKVIGSSGAEAP